MPVIASGGVGTLQHLVDGVLEGGADAVLAASIFLAVVVGVLLLVAILFVLVVILIVQVVLKTAGS